jgi:hypothetical protein
MSMLFRLPKYMPPLDAMLHDIFSPSPAALAAAMGVTERTVHRWIAKNDAPHPVKLALFWLTRWGMQWTDADLYNEAQLHFAMNRCQAGQIRDLKGKLRRTAKLANFGSANDPAEGVELPLPADTKPVQLHRPREPLPGTSKRGRGVEKYPGAIRERLCKPTMGYQQFVHKKRSAA